jgi:deazaflavin-dependent oxidoreductase (nitroreductase family)
MNDLPSFRKPNALDRIVNGAFAALLRLGFGLPHNYLLQVRGRKTARLYSTPVNLLLVDGVPYLVAPRGETQWARNVRAAGNVTLKKGRETTRYTVSEITDDAKLPLLKIYLERFAATVQRYFPIKAGAPAAAFAPLASRYPVFRLRELP